ncbi:hypothetical protein CWB96_17940 [Pseudoalteromonas citrea]|uniref:Uncharacterized protein n=1 Tax=Pseudoalteromonas citrea TaxID=43655 RepID=A0A5S3XK30_9GAMM|nr:hypothetical protein CWB97_15060 [Pseudoalteromonas citrea]TMP55121.1 hypothetical protein CWB96_17940 [Pseudoalteromonas citrea]
MKQKRSVEFTPIIQHGDLQRTVLEEWISFSRGKLFNRVGMSKRSNQLWGKCVLANPHFFLVITQNRSISIVNVQNLLKLIKLYCSTKRKH